MRHTFARREGSRKAGSGERRHLTRIGLQAELLLRMQDLGKMLVIAGIALVAIGALLWLGKGFRLPGDIYVERGSFSFGFPIVTCIVISIVLTLLLNFFRK